LSRWSFSRIKASISPAMPRILAHCSLYKVTGKRSMPISSSLCLTVSFPAVSWNTQADCVSIRSLVAH
jgi:hypothetical protein